MGKVSARVHWILSFSYQQILDPDSCPNVVVQFGHTEWTSSSYESKCL